MSNTNSEEYYLELAKKEALKSTYSKQQVGAVIVRKGTVVGRGYNQLRYVGKVKTKFPNSLHAEVAAILDTSRRLLTKSTIYVYRVKKDGTPAMAKPCSYCDAMLKFVGVKIVVYSTDEYYKIYNTKDTN